MFGNRRITENDVAMAVKAAAADATTSSLLAAHIAQCDADKREMREALQKQNADRERMHQENSVRFDKINRAVWMATGVIGSIVALLSTQFGSSLAAKLIH